MALSGSFVFTLLMCVPLGLGGGAVDAALNNFVALHYEARHMNWLHCFWGLGATLGPAVIGLLLRLTGQWRGGYLGMAAAQCALGSGDVRLPAAMATAGESRRASGETSRFPSAFVRSSGCRWPLRCWFRCWPTAARKA